MTRLTYTARLASLSVAALLALSACDGGRESPSSGGGDLQVAFQEGLRLEYVDRQTTRMAMAGDTSETVTPRTFVLQHYGEEDVGLRDPAYRVTTFIDGDRVGSHWYQPSAEGVLQVGWSGVHDGPATIAPASAYLLWGGEPRDGVRLCGFGTGDTSACVWAEAEPLIYRYPLRPGASWAVQAPHPETGTTVERRVGDRVAVTVPAGRFEAVTVETRLLETQRPSRITHTDVIADVGVVRRTWEGAWYRTGSGPGDQPVYVQSSAETVLVGVSGTDFE